MVDHLGLMGIQRWQRRKDRVLISKISGVVNELVIEGADIDADDDDRTHLETERPEKKVYAAQASDALGQRWLWVVNHSSINARELKLLDNIVNAVAMNWCSVSIADNYVSISEITLMLNKDIDAIVIFGQKDVSQITPLLGDFPLLITLDLGDLPESVENKRQVWKSLQHLKTSLV